ncbi:MAG TPA: 30S ribosomal protein S21 [Flavobacteriales bacterium]|jgi:small subunit ribosomal protein S21|nr:30S ribosomal protein S21 [Flavobacteriales bacterium]HJN64532.1 30S ribosomal protein S21 [Flavobacteriales bacterium]|tara:strand:+ start:349 stop:540 length:192 start_codon:yes stop_codon:yes gene_type:complete
MIIIPVKEGEQIDRALKRFKKKFLRTGTMKQLRSRKQFTKKSVILREQKLKAAYSQKLLQEDE